LDERQLRLTAVPRPGANALPAVSALIVRYDWDVPELHLEPGRLDEVFRMLTQMSAAERGAYGTAASRPAGTGGAPN